MPEEFIHKFRLANENYGDSLFIHPPIFVFLSAALSAIFSIPLPLCSVVYAAGTLLSIPFIILHSGLIEKQQQMSLILWSVVVYSFCPISMFVSQKFWIDNCLTLMVTFSMGIHLFLNNFKASTWIRQSLMAEFVSGLVFGIIALNCKVTAAASLPSMVLWIARSRFLFHLDKFRIFNHDCNESTGLTSQISDKLLQYPRRFQNFWSQFWQIIFDTFGHVLIFLVGAMCGHSPWVYLYWVQSIQFTWSNLLIYSHIFRVILVEFSLTLGLQLKWLPNPDFFNWQSVNRLGLMLQLWSLSLLPR